MLCWIAKLISGEDSTPLIILGHRKFKYSLVFKNKLKQIGLKVKYEDFSHLWLVVLDASSQKMKDASSCSAAASSAMFLVFTLQNKETTVRKKTSQNYEERKAQNTHRLYKRDYYIE